MLFLLLTNMAEVLASRMLAVTWVSMFTAVSGQALYKLELNDKVGDGIFVGSFQGDGYARDDTSLRYNDSINIPLLSYTYCHRVQMFYTRPRMYVSTYAFNNEESNELYSEYHLGRAAFRTCKRGTKYCGWHREMPPFNFWRHICITYDHFRDSYKLYVDGVKVESGAFAGDNSVEPIRPGGIFVVGQDQDELDGGYNKKQSWSGLITQHNLWDFSIEEFDIENFAECRSDAFGNIVRWDQDAWLVRNVKTERKPIFELCSNPDPTAVSYFLFPEEFDFNFYNPFCQNLGGRVPMASSEENFHEVMDSLENIVKPDIHEKCLHASGSLMIWVGATDKYEEGVWVDSTSLEPLQFPGYWGTGRPSAGTYGNCASTYLERKWRDQPCDAKFCNACSFSKRMNLTIRGLCPSDTKLMEGNFDMEYFIDGFVQNKAHWRGLGKSHIYYVKDLKSWKLESFYDPETKYAVFAADDSSPSGFYPLGRSEWKINAGICQKEGGVPHRMTLTSCVGGNDFTCNDGTCVAINKRCNLVTDCPDLSDEKNCDILSIGKDYRNELFPRSLDNGVLYIYVSVEILSLPKIDTLGLSFTADFDLQMKWVDPRLTFLDLRGASELNSLSAQVQSKIWSPKLSFTNAKIIGGTLVDDTTSTIIQRNGVPAPDDVRRAVEANVYEGVKSNILQKREYFTDWTCDYNLLFYPFDTQVCKMTFELSGGTKDYLQLEIDVYDNFTGVAYLGEKLLLEYTVGEMMMKVVNDSSAKYSSLKVSLTFTRRWFYHGINVFLQSVLLLIVAYMTFYYQVDNFQDRVMVCITTMIVIANVQTSINTMVPKTSYLKMIDFFLIYSFNIIVVVMVYHTYISVHTNEKFAPNEDDLAMNRVRKLGGVEGEDEKNNKLWNSFFTEGGKPVEKLKEAKRINQQGQVIFVIAFIIFQIVFWSVGLSEFYSDKNIEKMTAEEEIREELSTRKVI